MSLCLHSGVMRGWVVAGMANRKMRRGHRGTGGLCPRVAIASLVLMVFCQASLADPIPDESWLGSIVLLAHSQRDQSVVLQMPDGERQLLVDGERISGVYDLELLKVHGARIELIATHPSVNDRKLRLWFKPGGGAPQVVSSALAQPISQALGPGGQTAGADQPQSKPGDNE